MADRRQLYLIFKEWLHNIARHSGATEVEIRLCLDGGRLRLHIDDNGRGFVLGQAKGGHGLDGIKKRSSVLGAECRITSEPGSGATLEIDMKMTRTRGGRG